MCLWLPSQLESNISSFYFECGKFLQIRKYPFLLIGNMGETPVFFDMVPERSLVSTCRKSVTIPTSGLEKRHVTVVLTVAANGFILPPILIFRGKANLTIKYIIRFCHRYPGKSMDG